MKANLKRPEVVKLNMVLELEPKEYEMLRYIAWYQSTIADAICEARKREILPMEKGDRSTRDDINNFLMNLRIIIIKAIEGEKNEQ